MPISNMRATCCVCGLLRAARIRAATSERSRQYPNLGGAFLGSVTVGVTRSGSHSRLYQLIAARIVFKSCRAVWSDTLTGGLLDLRWRFLHCDVRQTT